MWYPWSGVVLDFILIPDLCLLSYFNFLLGETRQETDMVSFHLFDILNIFHLFQNYLIFYLLKMMHYKTNISI